MNNGGQHREGSLVKPFFMFLDLSDIRTQTDSLALDSHVLGL